MASEWKIYLIRAENNLVLAKANFDISIKNELKNMLGIALDKTFFNEVISESYYSIFYSAKAYLLFNKIKTSPPEEHRKTYDEFKKLVESGKIDKELLKIYDAEAEKAEALLKIFFDEKRKRGNFTYHIKSEANIPKAEESINNARKFAKTIKRLLEEQ